MNTRITTADDPLIIENPSLGFVNLFGPAANDLIALDRADLSAVFENNVHVAQKELPKCNVLFAYCNLETSGRVAGFSFTFRDLLPLAGAHIGVLASELEPSLLSNPEFAKSLSTKHGWPANVVITLNRNGDYFGRFFRELFSQMKAGIGMPMAWVTLAPQGPHQRTDIPGTICLMEAGHIAFGLKKS
jgi:hypothetical protein